MKLYLNLKKTEKRKVLKGKTLITRDTATISESKEMREKLGGGGKELGEHGGPLWPPPNAQASTEPCQPRTRFPKFSEPQGASPQRAERARRM